MKISVIIPCYNQAHFLAEAIESAIGQAACEVEVVVVNDGSTDGTSEVARKYSDVVLVEQENQGLSRARNNGYAACSGEHVVFLDSDDRLPEGALRHGLECLAANPQAAFAYGLLRRIDTAGEVRNVRKEPEKRENHYHDLLQRNYIPTPGMVLFRRATLERFGLFDPALSESADYDIYLRIAREAPIVSHQHPAVDRRIHDDNMSGDAERMLRITLKVHEAQRIHARQDPQLMAAFRDGRQNWRRFYGDQLIDQFLDSWRNKRLGKAARQGWLLARHCRKRIWLRLNPPKPT